MLVCLQNGSSFFSGQGQSRKRNINYKLFETVQGKAQRAQRFQSQHFEVSESQKSMQFLRKSDRKPAKMESAVKQSATMQVESGQQVSWTTSTRIRESSSSGENVSPSVETCDKLRGVSSFSASAIMEDSLLTNEYSDYLHQGSLRKQKPS